MCMEPTSAKLLAQTGTSQRDAVGYVIPGKDSTDYKEVTRFGGEMMQASLTSLERATGCDAEGNTTSLNAYITTASGHQMHACYEVDTRASAIWL